jgi:hypothetical protein
MMKRALKFVNLADIRIDGGTQVRVSVSPEWIQGMVDNMKNDVEYPPVEARFDGTHYWLSDGFHRYHAQSRLGLKSIEVAYLPGTMHDAQIDALEANAKHGLPLTREDKIKKVQMALDNPSLKDLNDVEISRLCEVSKSFVGAVRRPEIKQKQAEAKKQHILKKAQQIKENTKEGKSESSSQTTDQPPIGGEGPDEAELLANEAQHAADLETLARFLDADDKMKHLYEEVQRLTSLNVGFELRIKELMNEKRSAVKLAEKLQRELDKIKGKK